MVGSTPIRVGCAGAIERGAVDRVPASWRSGRGRGRSASPAPPSAALPALVRAGLDASRADTLVTDVGSTKRLDLGGRLTTSGSSAATRSPAWRSRAFSTRAPTCSTAPPGTSRRKSGRAACSTSACTVWWTGAPGRWRSIPTRTTRLAAAVSHLPHVLANVLVSAGRRRTSGAGRGAPPAWARASATPPAWPARTPTSGQTSTAERRGDRGRGRARPPPGSPSRSAATGADGLRAWNDRARTDRRRLLEAARRGGAVHELRVTVPNRPGMVAEVALALGAAA